MLETQATPPAIHVHAATVDDAPQVISIVNAAFAVETFLDGTRIDAERIAEYFETGEFLVGVDDAGRVAASVYIEVRGESGYFGMLAVDPSQQGKGLARLMIEAAENKCRERGCTRMDIAVLSLRPELTPLYRKFGYSETGTEEFRPSRPLKPGIECHAILMSKAL